MLNMLGIQPGRDVLPALGVADETRTLSYHAVTCYTGSK